MPKLKCPKCKQGGYTQSEAFDKRPEFTCTKCKYTWTSGKFGGKYVIK